MNDADVSPDSEGSEEQHTAAELLPKDSLLTAPVLLLAEHILGSIPLWEVKSKNRARGVREKEVVREVFYRGELRRIPLVIYASGDLGLPNSVDLELFRGFERWAVGMLEHAKTLPPIVKISGYDLLRAAGKEPSGAAYAEVDRFFLRMAGTMIAVGRPKSVVEDEGQTTTRPAAVRLRTKKGIAFKIFGTVVLPGQVNGQGELADKYEVELPSWYRESLLLGNCFVIDHSLFAEMKGSLSKLLHQLLHNLFYLGKGHAEQRYSDLVRFWQIKQYQAKSRVMEQFAEAHQELSRRGFLERWSILPVGESGNKDFIFIWDAGPAWWETDSKLAEMRAKYGLGDGAAVSGDEHSLIDPFLTAVPDLHQTNTAEDPTAAARLFHEVMALSGRRKDPVVWEKWWKRAIAEIPHTRIWLRIGEVKERKARGEPINMGSYLAKLVKIEAKGLGLGWGEERGHQPPHG